MHISQKVFAHLPWLPYELSNIPFLIHRVQYDVSPPFAAKRALTLLGRLSTRFRSVFRGILSGHLRMSDQKNRLSVSALIHPKSVVSDWGQDSVHASQTHPQQTLSCMSLWNLLCALLHSHVEKREGSAPNCSHKVGSVELSKISSFQYGTWTSSINKSSWTR